MTNREEFIPLNFERKNREEQWKGVSQYGQTMNKRRSVRSFSDKPVSEKVIEKLIHAAGTSPSGANQQPWTFVQIKDSEKRECLREAAKRAYRGTEHEQNRAHAQDSERLYITEAPTLVALFCENYGLEQDSNGQMKRVKHYYALESVSICAGFFLAAVQHAGLDSIVHAPIQEGNSILERPKNESMIALFAIGYASEGYEAPLVARKSLNDLIFGDISLSDQPIFAPSFSPHKTKTEAERYQQAEEYYQIIKKRRNVRHFSTEQIDEELIIEALRSAVTTPSAGNVQPYRFAVIKDPEKKKRIREQAEIEEKKLYEERMSAEWKEALAPLGTNWQKPHLTDAPYIIIAFKVEGDQAKQPLEDGTQSKKKTHLAMISTGMAVGILMGALHHAGLCTLTHTPSPMTFLRDYLQRPKNEMPIVVLPVGYPTENCMVPNISKKQLEDILVKS